MAHPRAATVTRRTLLTGAAALIGAPLATAAVWPRPAAGSEPERLHLLGGTGPDPSTDPVIGFVQDRGRYTTFSVPNRTGNGVALTGITERGEIVGKFPDEEGIYHGVVRDLEGRYRRIDVPGAMGTYAIKINNVGQIVGTFNTTSRTVTALGGQGYLLDRGRFISIAPPGAMFSQALGINNLGQVVGEYLDSDGVNHGFLWHRGRFTTIDVPRSAGTSVTDINDLGEMVGITAEDETVAAVRGFVYRRRRFTLFDLPGREVPLVTDINNPGQIAGTAVRNPADSSTFLGFVLAGPGGPLTAVAPPGSPASFVGGLNDRGQVCGTAANPDADPAQGRPAHLTMMGLTA
jgi:probable HAF family extracellular repeat protein